ncbi:MAG: hypothetical protein ABI760_06600 [Ferruginibacter sp.]
MSFIQITLLAVFLFAGVQAEKIPKDRMAAMTAVEKDLISERDILENLNGLRSSLYLKFTFSILRLGGRNRAGLRGRRSHRPIPALYEILYMKFKQRLRYII